MSNDYHEIIIKDEANKIREKITGGMIYGIPVDLNNPDHVIFAAYLLALSEELRKNMDRFQS